MKFKKLFAVWKSFLFHFEQNLPSCLRSIVIHFSSLILVQSVFFVFFSRILKYSRLLPLFVFPRCECVYTHQAGRTPALQQNWQSSEESQHFKENTIFNEHSVLESGGNERTDRKVEQRRDREHADRH